MAEKSLGKKDLEQMFEGFEKRQDKIIPIRLLMGMEDVRLPKGNT